MKIIKTQKVSMDWVVSTPCYKRKSWQEFSFFNSLEFSGDKVKQISVYEKMTNAEREVAELLNESVPRGTRPVYFDASNLASGIYFYTLKAGSYQATKKMMVLR